MLGLSNILNIPQTTLMSATTPQHESNPLNPLSILEFKRWSVVLAAMTPKDESNVWLYEKDHFLTQVDVICFLSEHPHY